MTLREGVVTFMFTDVEGSTRLLNRLGDRAYQQLIEAHRFEIRDAIELHKGREIGTEGDSFFIAFGHAREALDAGLLIQTRLSNAEFEQAGLRVRIGVNTGEAVMSDGLYYGIAVHEAARVVSAAHGGQVLASESTVRAVQDSLPDGVELVDLGDHRLKDLERPIRLWQVGKNTRPNDFPPPRTLSNVKHNLPIQTSKFVGREEELRNIAKLIGESRLLTLVGPGGAGKTRLAYQAAVEAIEQFPGGVRVIELQTASDKPGVDQTALRALQLRGDPARSVEQLIASAFRGRQVLLIVDNCEHVIEAAAEFIRGILLESEEIHILATSREQVRLSGEMVLRVQGLEVAGPGLRDMESVVDSDAVRLFGARAAEADPAFNLSPDNLETVAAICSQLDGLPLAIELAAARIRILSPDQLHERLNKAFTLLSNGDRSGDERHSTIRNTIEWSHNLLDDAEQTLLRRLSVFKGGWNLDAAEFVCSAAPIEEQDVVELLNRLVDKSLVDVFEGVEQTRRFRMLETVASFSRGKLDESDEAQQMQQHHANWYASLSDEAGRVFDASGEGTPLTKHLEQDHSNLIAALRFLRNTKNPRASSMAINLLGFWDAHGHSSVARSELTELLSENLGDHTQRFRLLNGLANTSSALADYEVADRHYTEALELAGSDPSLRCRALLGQAWVRAELGELERSEALLVEAFTLAQQCGDSKGLANCAHKLGVVAVRRGKFAEARTHYELALEIAKKRGDVLSEARLLGNLAQVEAHEGDLERGRNNYERALAVVREFGDRRSACVFLGNLGVMDSTQGDHLSAKHRYEESLSIAQDLGARQSVGWALGNLGGIAFAMGDLTTAREHLSQSIDVFAEIGNDASRVGQHAVLGDVEYAQGNLNAARLHWETAYLYHKNTGNTLAQPLLLGNLAAILFTEGRFNEARQLREEALHIARQAENRQDEAHQLSGLGDIKLRTGDAPGAIAMYRAALDIAEELGAQSVIAEWTSDLGLAFQECGNLEEAARCYEKARLISSEIGDWSKELACRIRQAQLSLRSNDVADAHRRATDALEKDHGPLIRLATTSFRTANTIKAGGDDQLQVELIETVAVVLAATGQAARSLELLSWAAAKQTNIEPLPDTTTDSLLAHAVRQCHALLSPDEIELAEKAAQGMSIDEALDLCRESLRQSEDAQ